MISVIIPFLNEEKNLPILFEDLVNKVPESFEVIFVNDGSTDKSDLVLGDLLEKSTFLFKYQYLIHKTNKGIGESFRSGIKAANGSYITMLASDNEDNISDIIFCERYLNDFDVVMMYNQNSSESRSLIRRVISIIFRTYLNAKFDTKILYFNAFSNIYPTKLLRDIKINSSGFFLMAEVAIKANRHQSRILHYPRTLSRRVEGKSKSLTFRNLLVMFRDYRKAFKDVEKS